jgi:vacuolar protein sorting-associated protein 3
LPQVAVSKLNEYLLVVCTGTSPDYKKVYSMGIFVNGEGDPTQAPLEWGSYPTTVCVDGEMVFSLHLDANSSEPTPTIEVRMINSQTLHQSFSLEAIQGNIQLLSLARPGFATPVNARQEKLTQKDIPIFEAKRVKENGTKKTVKGGDENVQNPAGSSLTPPPTPKPPRPGHQYSRSQGKGDVAIETAQGSEAPSALPTSHILLATSRAVYALLPLTLLSQIESLIDEGKVKEASALLSQSQAKHAKDENLVSLIGLDQISTYLLNDHVLRLLISST